MRKLARVARVWNKDSVCRTDATPRAAKIRRSELRINDEGVVDVCAFIECGAVTLQREGPTLYIEQRTPNGEKVLWSCGNGWVYS